MEDVVKMIKVKVPVDKKNLNLGFKIVEVSEELAGEQFSRPVRNPHWEHVEVATESDLKQLDNKGILKSSNEEMKKAVKEANDSAEFLKMENEEMKKRIAELEAKEKSAKEIKKETKEGEGK